MPRRLVPSNLGRLGPGVLRPIDGRRPGKLSDDNRSSELRPFDQRRSIGPRYGGQDSGRRLPLNRGHRLGRPPRGPGQRLKDLQRRSQRQHRRAGNLAIR